MALVTYLMDFADGIRGGELEEKRKRYSPVVAVGKLDCELPIPTADELAKRRCVTIARDNEPAAPGSEATFVRCLKQVYNHDQAGQIYPSSSPSSFSAATTVHAVFLFFYFLEFLAHCAAAAATAAAVALLLRRSA